MATMATTSLNSNVTIVSFQCSTYIYPSIHFTLNSYHFWMDYLGVALSSEKRKKRIDQMIHFDMQFDLFFSFAKLNGRSWKS